jgi:hypothetical protein
LGVQQLPTTGTLFPAYVRGLAYLSAGDGKASASEFQKLLDHRSDMGNCPLGALTFLGLARAYAMKAAQGLVESCRNENRRGYGLPRAGPSRLRGLLDLWKDADANIPVLREAKEENARTVIGRSQASAAGGSARR